MCTSLNRILLGLVLSLGLLACQGGVDLKTSGDSDANEQFIFKYQPGAKVVIEEPEKEGTVHPLAFFNADQVCTGITFYNQEGELVEGSRLCDRPYEGVDPNLTPENIKSGISIAGVEGTLEPRPDACNTDGSTDCLAVAAFPAVDASRLLAGNLKNGVTLGAIAGLYPSATYPLTGADATADLTNPTFNAQVKSSTAFEWFDSSGERYSGAGDADLTAANIMSGKDIFGSVGTFGPDCTADGQTSCLTTSTFKSVNTSAITAWDIRSGKSAGGISGSLQLNKNMTNITLFNRTAGTAANNSTTVADVYDTIDDNNADGAFPNEAPPTFSAVNAGVWLRDSTSDNGAGGGVSLNGICDGTEDCVYTDQITKHSWAKVDVTTRNWETAITYCEDLSYGGHVDWRLPTQKELYQAYIDGVWSQKTALGLSENYFWTSSTQSDLPLQGWIIFINHGRANYATKTTAYYAFCTR